MKNILKDFGKATADGAHDVFEFMVKRDKDHFDQGPAYAFAQGMINGLMGLVVVTGLKAIAGNVTDKFTK